MNKKKEIKQLKDEIDKIKYGLVIQEYSDSDLKKRLEELYDHFNLEYSTEEKGVVKKDK